MCEQGKHSLQGARGGVKQPASHFSVGIKARRRSLPAHNHTCTSTLQAQRVADSEHRRHSKICRIRAMALPATPDYVRDVALLLAEQSSPMYLDT
jgi:hypothetical protein